MIRTAGKILALLAAACAFTLCALAGGASALATNNPSPLATGSIPADLLVLFQQASAASPCGVPWTLLAAVAKTESSFDPTAVSGAGAEGMFQFEPATFVEYAKPIPSGGAVPPTPFDPTDAAYCRRSLPVLARGRPKPDSGVGGLQLRQRRTGVPGRIGRLRRTGAGHGGQLHRCGCGSAERCASGRRCLRRVSDRNPLRLRR